MAEAVWEHFVAQRGLDGESVFISPRLYFILKALSSLNSNAS